MVGHLEHKILFQRSMKTIWGIFGLGGFAQISKMNRLQ